MVGRLPRWLQALVIYGILTITLTWPLALRWTTDLPGGPHKDGLEDAYQNVWNLWWVRTAVTQGLNPLITDRFFYPEQPNLYYHTLSLINTLLAVPVTAIWGPIAAFNAVAFASFVIGAFGMWLLAYERTQSHAGALLAGLIFAFSPFHFGTLITDGQLQIVALHWVPFYVLFLLRALERGGRWNILLAGLFLTLNAWTDWYYTLFLLIFTAGYAAWRFVARAPTWSTRWLLVQRLIGLGVLFTFGAAPLVVPMLIEATRADYMNVYPSNDPERLAIDLLAYVLPARLHSWWGAAPWDWGVSVQVNRRFYLGVVALLLALLGLWRSTAARRWGWVALATGVLALGPTLRVDGDITGIPLPYRLIANLPIIRLSREPARFDVLVTLALAMLVAYGVRAVLLQRSRAFAIGLTSLLIIFVSLDYLVAPIITRQPQIPPFLATLAHSDDGALLEFPFHDTSPYRDAERMLFQTVHGRPISGGYHSRRYPQTQLGLPVLRDLIAGRVGGDIADTPGGWPAALNTLGFRYIIGYKQQPLGPRNLQPDEVDDFRKLVEQGLGVAQPDYEDDWLIAYQVPDARKAAVIGFSSGWGAVEQDAGHAQRWLAQTGELSLVAPVAGQYELTWLALPAQGIHTIEMKIGAHVTRVPLDSHTRRYRLLLDLPAGASQLRMRVLEPATTGDALVHNGDMRLISVRFADVALTPQGE